MCQSGSHAWTVSSEAMADSGERAVELSDYLDILRRRWLGVVIITLTTLALASAVTLAMPKKYTATTRLFIAVAGESATDLAQGSNFAEKQMSSYAEVATSPRVLAPVIRAARSANHSEGAGRVGGGHRASGHGDS